MPEPNPSSQLSHQNAAGESLETRTNSTAGAAPAVDSSSLMKGQKELLINHLGEIYRLRITRNGKLILHK
ncbi:Hemin uptake protein hemP [Planctopirus ephydatiae]|uniref:Hemin uptake protein hemP n=1 Tax=Planctopirus ephydatiae TaxID=2528019 RepID=A0A518GJS6_9PLAN|nr:hemin uptake protein HemP [Planctopirus ephydatiae]QDV28838.1 Hemin uptake protein hemP [Planctopirus ephydatiae]